MPVISDSVMVLYSFLQFVSFPVVDGSLQEAFLNIHEHTVNIFSANRNISSSYPV